MRPHPVAHTHWSISRKYPPPMGATSSRPYLGGHIPKCDPIQGQIPIGLLLGRTPPTPYGSYILSKTGWRRGWNKNDIPGKELQLWEVSPTFQQWICLDEPLNKQKWQRRNKITKDVRVILTGWIKNTMFPFKVFAIKRKCQGKFYDFWRGC